MIAANDIRSIEINFFEYRRPYLFIFTSFTGVTNYVLLPESGQVGTKTHRLDTADAQIVAALEAYRRPAGQVPPPARVTYSTGYFTFAETVEEWLALPESSTLARPEPYMWQNNYFLMTTFPNYVYPPLAASAQTTRTHASTVVFKSVIVGASAPAVPANPVHLDNNSWTGLDGWTLHTPTPDGAVDIYAVSLTATRGVTVWAVTVGTATLVDSADTPDPLAIFYTPDGITFDQTRDANDRYARFGLDGPLLPLDAATPTSQLFLTAGLPAGVGNSPATFHMAEQDLSDFSHFRVNLELLEGPSGNVELARYEFTIDAQGITLVTDATWSDYHTGDASSLQIAITDHTSGTGTSKGEAVVRMIADGDSDVRWATGYDAWWNFNFVAVAGSAANQGRFDRLRLFQRQNEAAPHGCRLRLYGVKAG